MRPVGGTSKINAKLEKLVVGLSPEEKLRLADDVERQILILRCQACAHCRKPQPEIHCPRLALN